MAAAALRWKRSARGTGPSDPEAGRRLQKSAEPAAGVLIRTEDSGQFIPHRKIQVDKQEWECYIIDEDISTLFI